MAYTSTNQSVKWISTIALIWRVPDCDDLSQYDLPFPMLVYVSVRDFIHYVASWTYKWE